MLALAHQMPWRSQFRKEDPLPLHIVGCNARFRSKLGLAIKSLAVILSVFCVLAVTSAQGLFVPSAQADQSASSAPKSESYSKREQLPRQSASADISSRPHCRH